jgi:large subunit ribosomal protein L32
MDERSGIFNLKFEINGVIMPNPKRRHSKSRTRQRRAHDALTVPQFYLDKDTGEAKKPHRIDPKTGMYKGRQIIEVRTEE